MIPHREWRAIVSIPVPRRATLHDPAPAFRSPLGPRRRIVHHALDVHDTPFRERRAELTVLCIESATYEQRPRNTEDDSARDGRAREGRRHRALPEVSTEP